MGLSEREGSPRAQTVSTVQVPSCGTEYNIVTVLLTLDFILTEGCEFVQHLVELAAPFLRHLAANDFG